MALLGTYTPKKTQAGDYPVVTDSDTIKTGENIKEFMPICKTNDGIVAATKDTINNVYGLAATDSDEAGNIVFYVTGEYFEDSLVCPTGTTAKDFKEAFRKINIFLK